MHHIDWKKLDLTRPKLYSGRDKEMLYIAWIKPQRGHAKARSRHQAKTGVNCRPRYAIVRALE